MATHYREPARGWRKAIQQRAAARARADNDDIKVFVHNGGWSGKGGKPYSKAGEDPTEPWRANDYPFPPISHEPRIAEVFQTLKARGLKPYPAPMGVRLNEAAMNASLCIRCATCDG